MQETMNVQSNTRNRKPSQPSVGENVSEELTRLRDELSRTAHSLRMKSKGASAEVQDTRRMLEREAKRFRAEVGEAVERTQEDLIQAGKDLQMRFQKVASQIVLPPS